MLLPQGIFLSMLKSPRAIVESGLKGPFIKDISKVSDFIKNSDISSFLLVTNPEALILSETKDLVGEITQNFPDISPLIFLNKFFSTEDKTKKDDIVNFDKKLGLVSDYIVKKLDVFQANVHDFERFLANL